MPWRDLSGKAMSQSVSLMGDVGVLRSDPDGQATVARCYWANRKFVMLGDLPAEARIHPAL